MKIQKLSWPLAGLVGALAVGALALGVRAGFAQTYPDHPVKIIISFAPGGGADLAARTIAAKLQDSLGKPFIVENRPGGTGGSLGIEAVVRAAPDGYTLLVTPNGPIVIGTHFQKQSYDVLKDLTPIGMAAFAGSGIAVPASTPVHNIAELVKYSKERPEGLSFSHPGPGNQMHLAGEMLRSMTGANLVGIPYKGNAPAVGALLTGDVQVSVSDLVSLIPLAEAGKIRIIAVTNSVRQKIVPDVPTVAEFGYPEYAANAWVGLFGPAGMPKEIVDTLNAGLGKAMAASEVQQTFAKLGMDTTSMTPDAMRKFVTDDFNQWGRVIKSINLKVE